MVHLILREEKESVSFMVKVSTVVQYQNASASVATEKVVCLFEQRFKQEYPEQNFVSVRLYCVPEQNCTYGVVLTDQKDFVYRTSESLDSPAIAA